MAKGYLIAHMVITNPEGMKEYAEKVTPLLKRFGVNTLVRGGRFQQLEGESMGTRHVVHEFPSYEQALAFYNSPEYSEIRGIRWKNTIPYAVVVEGV